MSEYHPRIHGLHNGYNNGILVHTRFIIIKARCGPESPMSRTQKNRRKKKETAVSLQDQYRQIGGRDDDVSLVFVLSVSGQVNPPDKYRFLDCIPLQENVCTPRSFNSGVEYLSIFSKKNINRSDQRLIQEKLQSLKGELARSTRPPRSIGCNFVKKLQKYPGLTQKNPLTKNQKSVADCYRQVSPGGIGLINTNGSVGFLKGRTLNAKIQSMTGPTIITPTSTHKLSIAGQFLYRGIPVPSVGPNGKIIRHLVHPHYINLIFRHF